MANFFDQFDQGSTNFFDKFDAPSSAGVGGTALDVAKQAGVGLAQGVEGIPTAVPALIDLVGRGAQAGLDKFAPGFTDPTLLANQNKLKELAAQARGGGIADYLPKAETPAGDATRQIASFIPSALGLRGSLVNNAIGGTAAGLGAYGAGKIAPTEEAKPYFELGGALLGGGAGLRGAESVSNRLAARGVPAAEDIIPQAKQIYTDVQARTNENPVLQGTLTRIADEAAATLKKEGPRAEVASGVHGVINDLRGAPVKQPTALERLQAEMNREPLPPQPQRVRDVADLVAARQNLKSFFENPLPDPNKAGAAKILPQIDAAIERLSPGTMKELRAADANYSAGKTAERLDKRIARAELRAAGEHSGLNLGNKLRQNATSMLLSNKESRGLSDANKAALESLVRGTTTQNLMRFGSNLLGGGGGLGSTLLGIGAGAGGYATGNPELAGLPIAGIGLRMLSNRSIANQAKNISAQIRARSPYVQNLGIPGPSRRLSALEAALLSSVYASPASRGLLSTQQ